MRRLHNTFALLQLFYKCCGMVKKLWRMFVSSIQWILAISLSKVITYNYFKLINTLCDRLLKVAAGFPSQENLPMHPVREVTLPHLALLNVLLLGYSQQAQ